MSAVEELLDGLLIVEHLVPNRRVGVFDGVPQVSVMCWECFVMVVWWAVVEDSAHGDRALSHVERGRPAGWGRSRGWKSSSRVTVAAATACVQLSLWKEKGMLLFIPRRSPTTWRARRSTNGSRACCRMV